MESIDNSDSGPMRSEINPTGSTGTMGALVGLGMVNEIASQPSLTKMDL
jgi:hypothetical protein